MEEIPHSSYDIKDLRSMPQGLRVFLIARIVQEVVPNPDDNAQYDSRNLELIEYAKFLERKTFENMETPDKYYVELAGIIHGIQKRLKLRPPGDVNDPYSNIPPSDQLAAFMGLTKEEIEEHNQEQTPQGPSNTTPILSMDTVTPDIRLIVVGKLCKLLFPPPDTSSILDGRMSKIIRKLKKIEAESFKKAEHRDDYFVRSTVKAYMLHKIMKKKGKSYIGEPVRQHAPALSNESVDRSEGPSASS
ncbi:unnamed protein product [Caenorhabditis sp. 36 PRJEB53466]|nr:unnamed protein product [Caenorhabditis sp. 36 PRJEB53466]